VPLGAWVAQANCRGKNTAVWFPGRDDVHTLAVAREVCRACVVRRECLEYAVQFPAGELLGVWGGLSQRERRQLRTRMGVTSSP
jgi:WhiB family redox-sensing transcriptional regulator